MSSAGSSLGPYRLLGVLGRGGMGVVYRGEHIETGQLVAVKTVIASSGSTLASIRREIHALGRVRHPGVVPIVASGVERGIPWYAMALLQGPTLRRHLAELWIEPASRPTSVLVADKTAPYGEASGASAAGPPSGLPSLAAPPLGPTLTLLRRLCAPLGYLHGAGLVHRDLKPDNVILQDDGRPVLVDLGIAARFGGAEGRESLEAEGKVVGTVAYMAPEQIRGELVDARADLYALGCILYECATGRPPFTGAQVNVVLFQHLFEAPIPPSVRASGVPDALDRLILRLLEKRPQDRLGYADDVAAALEALGAEPPPESGPRPRAYLYRPDFTGRGGALSVIGAAMKRAERAGPGGVVLVRGESGVGKTRLAMEVARLAVRRDMAVLTGQCVAIGAGEAGDAGASAAPLRPLRPLLLAVADRCREGGDGATRLLGSRAKVLSPYEPSLLDLPGARDHADPPPLPPGAARERVLEALRATLFHFTEAAPLVLILDDLQWADELTLSLLESLPAAGLGGRRALIVGAYRMEEAPPALEAMVADGRAVAVTLDRLDAASVGAMASGMLALREPPEGFVDFLVERSSGNPFFVAEYLRAAIGEGLLARDQRGRWRFEQGQAAAAASLAALPLPETLAELIDRRLARLGARERALVAWGAVLGREFDGDLLMVGAEAAEGAAMEAVEGLRVRQILEEAAGGRLRFVHDKIREIAYERLPDAARAALHLRAGEAIEARVAEAADHSPELGHHFARAGVHGKASHYFARAAERARAAYANGEAIASYRAAIAEGRKAQEGAAGDGAAIEPPDRLHEPLGEVLSLVGRQDEARDAYREALAAAPEHDRVGRARLCLRIGKAWEIHHQHAEALRSFDEAEAHLGEAPPASDAAWWDLWVLLQVDRVSIHYWRGDVDRIAACIERARPIVERQGTLAQRAQFFQALMHQSIRADRYATSAETVDITRRCLAAREELGDPGEVLTTRFALAAVLLWHGALGEAEKRLLAVLAEATRVGDAHHEARCLTYLAIAYRRQGRVEDARALADRGLDVARRAELRDHAGAAVASRAWASWRDGDAGEAERLALEALSLWQPISSAYAFPFQWTARLPLLDLALRGGDVAGAVEQARAVLDGKQQRLPDGMAAPLERAVDAWGRGQGEAAKDELARAVEASEGLGWL
ncbi:AAA family ATPase [Sorangium sp. So ce291]|uniref:serine/threonine-protein kinase n=1 Tax=Sorangium sp. So ce291 TaxID=3133294 RepID=UPI003F622379